MFNKAFGARLKSASDETGVVEAIVATYDKDSVGDKIKPGAFAKTLADWQKSGKGIPFLWSHKHDDPDAFLGEVLEAKETEDGLWVKAQIDMDHPPAKRVFDLMNTGKVSQFSFAYEVEDGEYIPAKEKSDGGKTEEYYELRQLKVFEVGPCLVGANQNTRLLGAKRADFVPDEKADEMPSWQEVRNAMKTLERAYGIMEKKGITLFPDKESVEQNGKDDEPQAKSDDHDVSLSSVALKLSLLRMQSDV